MSNHFKDCGSIVVIGGGFAGLTTVLCLKKLRPASSIILIEPRPRFVFLPLLYELLSDEVQVWEIAPSFRSLLLGKGVVLVEESVEDIDTAQNVVVTSSGKSINYKTLVVATGFELDSFNIPGVFENSMVFKSVEDVLYLKNKISNLNNNRQERKDLVIVGAGATGVELACKLSDLLGDHIQLKLIESGMRVLPRGRSFNQEQAEQVLKSKNVHLLLNTFVRSVARDSVELESLTMKESKKYALPHSGLIWTAGVRPVIPAGIPSKSLLNGRVLIDSSLKVQKLSNVFAIGDIAYDPENPCFGSAQIAMQHAEVVADNIVAFSEDRPLKSFDFKDVGEMLSLGIGNATITAFGLTLSGSLAYQLRRAAYLSRIPSFSLGVRSAGAWLIPDGKKLV